MKNEWAKKIICVIILAVLAGVSMATFAPKAQNPENYPKTIASLDELENKALVMTATSAALATGAAAIPGDATTPIANKLADITGYMIIVYIAIMLEKYLLPLTGLVSFRLMIPAALVLIGVSIFLRSQNRKLWLRKTAARLSLMGLLLWVLVPSSMMVTGIIENTYQMSYGVETELEQKMIEELEQEQEEAETEKGFSISGIWESLQEKTEDIVDSTKDSLKKKTETLQQSLNRMIEGVAVMIVTTCVIPLCVLFLFIWIIKTVIGLHTDTPFQKLPKASALLKQTESEK